MREQILALYVSNLLSNPLHILVARNDTQISPLIGTLTFQTRLLYKTKGFLHLFKSNSYIHNS